ncbi:MAG: RluA family pseudouridine synthase [Lachnospiraceae bacterium]|nr:RluA family pseudouridine synthase [Lachnospiraceae bacterium]
MRCKIIYEDGELLVVHKPAGLATESARTGQMDAESELKGYLKKSGTQKELYLGVVHRLDQPVEGLLVFAKTRVAAAALSKQLQKGSLNKTYLAVICGKMEKEAGELLDDLVKDGNVARVVTGQASENPQAKRAALSYRTLQSFGDDASLLEVQIETGRFHQIRAQLSNAGHPILGDQKYGSTASCEVGRQKGVRSVALCAASLDFQHPVTKKNMHFVITPEGQSFQSFLETQDDKK